MAAERPRRVAILGGGAWGTALAISASRSEEGGNAVVLWVRDALQARAMDQTRHNHRYLPDVRLPDALDVQPWPATGNALAALSATDLVVVATPVAALRGVLQALQGLRVPVVWLCKGFEQVQSSGGQGLLPHEVQQQVAPQLRAGVLSGPSFAIEVARAQPTAVVAASADAQVRELLVQAFHGPSLRVYASEDVVGVEVGGAVKNVLAIAIGLSDGLGLGLNARAALITRGLHEMARLGAELGARPETFMGLGGLGDLVLTATGDLSRNRKVGLALASGRSLQQAVDELGHVAEGVYCARTVALRARQLGVEMPITQAVEAVLDGRWQPAKALVELMGREARAER